MVVPEPAVVVVVEVAEGAQVELEGMVPATVVRPREIQDFLEGLFNLAWEIMEMATALMEAVEDFVVKPAKLAAEPEARREGLQDLRL